MWQLCTYIPFLFDCQKTRTLIIFYYNTGKLSSLQKNNDHHLQTVSPTPELNDLTSFVLILRCSS